VVEATNGDLNGVFSIVLVISSCLRFILLNRSWYNITIVVIESANFLVFIILVSLVFAIFISLVSIVSDRLDLLTIFVNLHVLGEIESVLGFYFVAKTLGLHPLSDLLRQSIEDGLDISGHIDCLKRDLRNVVTALHQGLTYLV
jgi:hypothetical protein